MEQGFTWRPFLNTTFVKVPFMFSPVSNGMGHKNDASWTGLMGQVSQTAHRGGVAFLQVGFEKETLWRSSLRLAVVWYMCNRWGLEFEWDWCCFSCMSLVGSVTGIISWCTWHRFWVQTRFLWNGFTCPIVWCSRRNALPWLGWDHASDDLPFPVRPPYKFQFYRYNHAGVGFL